LSVLSTAASVALKCKVVIEIAIAIAIGTEVHIDFESVVEHAKAVEVVKTHVMRNEEQQVV
jgi:hypothetical protein